MSSANKNAKDNFDLSWITKDTRCWIYLPSQTTSDLYVRGVIKGVVPLSINKANSRVTGITEHGVSFEVKAHQLEKCRDSNSMERDLIEMDIINAPEVLLQLKRRLAEQKIHTCLWNSLIIVNPFKAMPQQYSRESLSNYFQSVYVKQEDIRKHEPHIYSFMFHILSGLAVSTKVQVISISGESGSGKTQTNKQALRAISFCSSEVVKMFNISTSKMEKMILQCDPILQVFGNARTIKNDNSSRFGKLIGLRINPETMKIYHSSIKNYFLEKSRIISQSLGERNFHIFYQILSFLSEQQRSALRLKSHNGYPYRIQDFHYLSQKLSHDRSSTLNDRQMWDDLTAAFNTLSFNKQTIQEIYSVIAAVLLLGNINFEFSVNAENEPCEIKNPETAESVAYLLGMDRKDFLESLVTHRRTIAGELVLSALSHRQCTEGRDSMAKAIYESLFQWLIQELNRKLNSSHQVEEQARTIKLLDIYGFEVFQHNSFEQLCVNYTNERIHQIYLQQVFIHEKNVLRKEGLEHIIAKLNFTDNGKIIELLDTLNKSIFNLLDESCTLNVKDDDFLANIRKHHEQHDQFPPSNNVNLRRSFIVRHTPGDIEYMAEGFREKNKDLIREDIVQKLSKSKLQIISQGFKERGESLKMESNKRFLGVKIRKQVRDLISEMSSNTDLHFIRCIKPNEMKKGFTFVDKVCYNQIKYLGILDTIQMRKDSYHIRQYYSQFYLKYGILERNLPTLIAMSEGKISPLDAKDITVKFITNHFVNYTLEYQFGKEKLFLKMSTQNFFDNLLANRTKNIVTAATLIKAHYKRSKFAKERKLHKSNVPKIQRAVRRFLLVARQMRKKNAVRKIEKAWIQYHQTFFARKRRPKLMILQKYIRMRQDSFTAEQKIEAVRRCKFLLKSYAIGNQLQKNVQSYQSVKAAIAGPIFDQVWKRMLLHYRSNIVKYMRQNVVASRNSKEIRLAEENTQYKLNMKYKRYLEKYLHGFLHSSQCQKRLAAVLTIQSSFRMFKVRHKFNSLRRAVLKIQRNWRKYSYDKYQNINFTENYFQNNQQEGIKGQRQYWDSLLYRDLGESSKKKDRGVEKLLFDQEKTRQEKATLFYYLLDYEILSSLSFTYPSYSWIENYWTLYEQAWEKGNPIQTVQVSDQHTLCATLNKVYSWGNLSLHDFIENPAKCKTVKALSVPQGRLEKIHAHNNFSIVEVENEEPFIVGDSALYRQDSSCKEWKTLGESFVLINGIVLTLKRIQFSRLPISEKIVQLSCGMEHCIAKTSLRKVYTWGSNSNGQLGLGHFKRVKKPKILDFFKNTIVVEQVAASAMGCIVLDSNSRLYWWGTNGMLSNCSFPRDVHLFAKSQFLDNPQRYSVVRILPSWSRSLSLIGVTVCVHDSIFKSSQNNIKKKTFEHIMSKWNEDINSIFPPYIQTVSGYFQEKFMPKPKQAAIKNRDLQNQKIREKLLAQITLIEETERNLLQEHRKR